MYSTFLLRHICVDLMTCRSRTPTCGLLLCCRVTFAYLSSFICSVTFLEYHRSKIHRTLSTLLLRNCGRSRFNEFLFAQLFTQSLSGKERHSIFFFFLGCLGAKVDMLMSRQLDVLSPASVDPGISSPVTEPLAEPLCVKALISQGPNQT